MTFVRIRNVVSARGLALILACAGSAASAQTAPRTLEAGLADYLEMPITGTGQLARVNFLIEEPGASRLFVSDQTGTLYIVEAATTPRVIRAYDVTENGAFTRWCEREPSSQSCLPRMPETPAESMAVGRWTFGVRRNLSPRVDMRHFTADFTSP